MARLLVKCLQTQNWPRHKLVTDGSRYSFYPKTFTNLLTFRTLISLDRIIRFVICLLGIYFRLFRPGLGSCAFLIVRFFKSSREPIRRNSQSNRDEIRQCFFFVN